MYFFAYGMLTDGDIMPVTGVEDYGAAKLNGYELELFLYANLIPNPASTALGVLYDINNEVLAQLDLMEGYPILYTRKQMTVECQGHEIGAWVYLMTEDSRNRLKNTLPARSYIQTMKYGYADAGMSTSEITKALAKANARVRGEIK